MRNSLFLVLTVCLGFGSVGVAQEKTSPLSAPAPKSFAIGAEARHYLYSEPGFVSHEGYLFGVWGEWFWGSALGDGKTYANFIFGSLVYDGQACNLSGTVCTPLSATTNDFIGKFNTRLEYKVNTFFKIFYGGGFRYLYDKGEGASFYTRAGQWIYLPLGVAFNTETKAYNLFFEFEYDYTIYGVMRSALSEVSSTLNDVTSNQKGGYGLVLTAGLEFKKHMTGMIFYETWNANDSDIMASGGQNFREPANNSQSLGVKFGYRF